MVLCYVKVFLLPEEWTSTMRPLQDQCKCLAYLLEVRTHESPGEPTSYEDIETLFISDMGCPISDLFDDFDPNPIGVASLAQVHVGENNLPCSQNKDSEHIVRSSSEDWEECGHKGRARLYGLFQ